MMLNTAFLGLGSNLNSPIAQINKAIEALKNIHAIRVIDNSPLYLSQPVDNSPQPNYVNCALKVETSLGALDLLKACKRIESSQGREKTHHWGPRTIDIDILLYNSDVIKQPTLTIPHPEMLKRDFVLKPLIDIFPDGKMPDGSLLTNILKALKAKNILSPL